MKINIVCLKWGTKYGSEYPNRLYRMIQKNCKSEFKFYCCTDDASGLRPEVIPIELPKDIDLETYWWKLWIISNEFPIKGKCLFFDLDMVIQNDITDLIEYDCSDKVYVIKAQWRYFKVTQRGFRTTLNNSSVMLWNNQKRVDKIYDTFMSDPEYYLLKHSAGNDNYMEKEFPDDIDTLPTEWFYCRVWGYDDTDPDRKKRATEPYRDAWNIDVALYNMPERMVCLFNGIRFSEGIDDRIWKGFEHYWED